MAKRSFSFMTYTPVAVADTVAMTASTFQAILGGSATQRITYYEVYLGGQAGASSPTFMVFSRDTTVAVGTSALVAGQTDAPMDPATAALAAPPVPYVLAAPTLPQRSTTAHLLNLSFNAFGGIIRWVAAPGEEPQQVGNTQPLGECSLSAYTGGTPGLLGSHIVYEPSIRYELSEKSEMSLEDGGSKTHHHHRANRKTTHRTRLAPYISGAI